MTENKLKIAFLTFFSGVVYRGVETYVHELSNKLVSLGHDVTVYQNGSKLAGSKYKTVSMSISFESSREGLTGQVFNQIEGAFAVKKFTRKVFERMDKSTDIVVATNNRFQAYVSRFSLRGSKTKLVISGQGGPGIDERIALWSFPDIFIPLTQYQKSWAKKANPFVSVSEVIPNGVDTYKFGRDVKPFKFDLERPIILCAAALWPRMKRQQLLIKAVSKLEKGSVLLAGDGEGKKMLNSLGQKLLGKRRFLIRGFAYDEMPSVYSACNLFSFPTSSWEAFGIVLPEAMASGLPVVANDDPIRREIVGNAGYFVDPNNTENYAKNLKMALETNWGNKPIKQAENFDWGRIAKKYEELFMTFA